MQCSSPLLQVEPARYIHHLLSKCLLRQRDVCLYSTGLVGRGMIAQRDDDNNGPPETCRGMLLKAEGLLSLPCR